MDATAHNLEVGILGATGVVGQQFVSRLARHPWFHPTWLAASERSEGKAYAAVAPWRLAAPIPDTIGGLTVDACVPGRGPRVVFSALDASVAGEIEQAFAAAGHLVVSNARNYRMDPLVPLLIPEINADHLSLVPEQQQSKGWKGAIVTNPNCSTIVLAMALAPLRAFDLRTVFVSTMQAVSGAGYPGVPSLDILGNVIPYIADEEPKLELEMKKLLGKYSSGAVEFAPMKVSSHTNRVPVEHGHTVCITASFRNRVSPEMALDALTSWRGHESTWDLPSRPEKPLVVADEPNRPQPRRDVNAGNGMTVTVGRVRPDPILDIRMVALGHNTIRGAAGGSVLNAELLAVTGRLG